MNNIAIRVYIVAGIVVVAYGVSYMLQAATEPPKVEMPTWSIRDLPYQLGPWHGEDTELDPKIAAATGAAVIANRIYRNESGRALSMHAAMFEDPAEGVYHSPLNCYLASGWRKLDESREKIKVAEDLTIVAVLTTWEKEGEKILVVYWYQLGQHLLYSRFDLGGDVRWQMRGKTEWPALFKVMIQATVDDLDETKAATLGFAGQFGEWLNSPEHRKYLDRWKKDEGV